MLAQGVYLPPCAFETWFVSGAHDDEAVDRVLAALPAAASAAAEQSARLRGMTRRRGTTADLTVVHLLRHGEVHNPTGILYGRLPGYRLSERGRRDGRDAWPSTSPTATSPW